MVMLTGRSWESLLVSRLGCHWGCYWGTDWDQQLVLCLGFQKVPHWESQRDCQWGPWTAQHWGKQMGIHWAGQWEIC